MKKTKQRLPSFEGPLFYDFFSFLLALGYMQSVLTVANHISEWVHNGSLHTVQHPDVPALVIGLLLIGFSCYKRKGKFSALMIISLTIFATASIFWLSGLRTNFYY